MTIDANTTISRRTLAAGLALAPLAASPAMSGVATTPSGDDPVIEALAELRRVREWMKPIGDAFADAEANRGTDFDKAEAAWNEATSAELDAMRRILDAKPTTMAGAVALLRFASDLNFSDAGALMEEIQDAAANVADLLAATGERA